MPLSLLAALLFWGCAGEPEAEVTETVRPAYVVEVRAGGAGQLGFTGEVRAARRAELAFAVAGRVERVDVEVGDAVRRGQVLATLDTRPLAAQLAVAQGELDRIEAQGIEVRERLARVRQAQAGGAVAGGELEAAQAESAAIEAARRAAAGQRDAAAWSLEQATLRAPIDGTVAMRVLEPGQAGGPGAPVMAVDGEGRELSMLLPAAMAVDPGQAITLRSGGAEQASRVLRVAGRLETGGVRRVFVAVPDAAAVGSTWMAALDSPALRQATLQVPLRAVLPHAQPGRGRVLRLARDRRTVEAVDVELGTLHGPRVEISRGLAAGDQIVVAGAAGIRPGTLVRPVAYPGEVADAGVTP